MLLFTSASQAAFVSAGWFSIMSAEWHARQLLLIASAPWPVNIRSLWGRSTLTDLSWRGAAADPANGATTARVMSASDSIFWRMVDSPLARNDGSCFDDVAHEPRRVPVGLIGLRNIVGVGTADHERIVAVRRQREPGFPPPKTLLALVVPELPSLPSPAAIPREIHACNAPVATERDPACERRRAGAHLRARPYVRDE